MTSIFESPDALPQAQNPDQAPLPNEILPTIVMGIGAEVLQASSLKERALALATGCLVLCSVLRRRTTPRKDPMTREEALLQNIFSAEAFLFAADHYGGAGTSYQN